MLEKALTQILFFSIKENLVMSSLPPSVSDHCHCPGLFISLLASFLFTPVSLSVVAGPGTVTHVTAK